MKKGSWLLIANSSSARLFKIQTIHVLEEIRNFEHPESRLHNLDLVSDKPGRDFESSGMGRHALEPAVMPKQLEFELFAKRLADYLQEAHHKREFEDLYIAASPAFLGLLRQELSPTVTKSIKGTVDKDITQLKSSEILNHLPFI